MKKSKKGFTLVELLVVVLIIVILAAIAVPQYQMAVLKSKYSTLKQATKSLVEAEDSFYLANGKYGNAYELDVSVGTIISEFDYEIGNDITCQLVGINSEWAKAVTCTYKNNIITTSYQQTLENPKTTYCIVYFGQADDIYNKLCQQETGKNGYPATNTSFWYRY